MRTKALRVSSALILFVVFGVLFQNCSSSFSVLSKGALTSNGNEAGDTPNFQASDFISGKKETALAQQLYPCADVGYTGFNCINKVLTTKEGRNYNVTFRWNRINGNSAGTSIWVLGGNGRGKWRDIGPAAVTVQDTLDQTYQIRTVEIEFTDAPVLNEVDGGYWKHGGGYYSAALAYMEAVAYVTANLKVGQFMNHVGGSNGTMVAAFALSHFDAGAYVNRFVLHAGPFLPSLGDACDPNHFASFATSYVENPSIYNTIKSYLGTWSYKDPNGEVCKSEMIPRMSVLTGAKSSYPNNAIHVVMGAKEKTEGFGPWIIESNAQWFSQVQAAEKTRQVLPNLGHEMDWSSIVGHLSRPAPLPMGAPPVLTFSTTLGGAPLGQVSLSSQVYGSVTNIDSQSAMGCMRESSRLSECENPNNWLAFPNSEWTFSNNVWRSQFTAVQLGLSPGVRYVGFNVNTRTGQRSPLASVEVTADPVAAVSIYSSTLNGPAATRFSINQTVYGVARNLPQTGTKACMQESANFSLCNNPANWVSLPNNDWTWVNGAWRTQFQPSAIGAQASKTYLGFQVNTLTGERTPTTTLTVTN